LQLRKIKLQLVPFFELFHQLKMPLIPNLSRISSEIRMTSRAPLRDSLSS